MRRCLLLLPLALMFCVSSCSTIRRMNTLVAESTDSIYANVAAVQESTAMIRENARLVDATTRTVAENKRLLESVSH